MAYAARGIHAFILRYSTGRRAAGLAPLEEIDWTIGYIREHAAEWHIDPEKILTCGFSAGGHVALAAGTLSKNRPNGMVEGLLDIPVKVALMGCVVNGPGEAREADVGIAGGIGEAVLFRHGEIVEKIPEGAVIERLIAEVKRFADERKDK